jgi:HupE / UreJ protein
MSTFWSRLLRSNFLAAAWVWLAGAVSVRAHDPGLSTANVRLGPDAIEVVVVLSAKDALALAPLDADDDGKISVSEFAQGEPELGEQAALGLEFTLDDRPAFLTPTKCALDGSDNVTLHLRALARSFSKLRIRAGWLALLPPGHRQFLSVRSSNNSVLMERLLSASSDSVVIDGDETKTRTKVAAARRSFTDFLLLGLKHILIGYDHLLFLFSLLIVSRSFASTVKIITCFTLAHSLTLALATFGWVSVSGRVVEPLIAASIIFVAIENLVRGNAPKGRLLLVFFFGLVHGLGFASVLRELGVGSTASGVAVPLFSFNLGVELGQLLVAVLLLPIFQVAGRRPLFAKRWIPACSVGVALAGGYWLVQRVCFA